MEQFGFWTIPRMATVAFSLVILGLVVDALAARRSYTDLEVVIP